MQDFIISNGIIFGPDCKFHRGDLEISDGLIFNGQRGLEAAERINAEKFFIIPGLVDIHFHGCKGHDISEGTEEAFKAVEAYEASAGVTTICPATLTLPHEKLLNIMREAKKFKARSKNFAGIYLEGPFISSRKTGAQNPEFISRPDINFLRELYEESGGLIRIVTIAPELEGAGEFIEAAKNFTRLSLAHSDCDYEQALQAFEKGVGQATHLFNAMNPIKHRAPGPIIAALEDQNVKVELICDGVHIHPAVFRNAVKIFGPERVIFISDSLAACGMPDGEYELGGLKVIKRGRLASLADGVTIAGSVTTLTDGMITAVKNMGVPLEAAVRCSTINPAKAIGLENFCGSIQPGRAADLVALDKDLNVKFIFNKGELIKT